MLVEHLELFIILSHVICTHSVGAVAMLIGPGASVVFDASARASHMAHSYDFFKPHLSSPYPVVDGKGSAICYLRSLDTCYQRLRAKRQQVVRRIFL